MPFDYFPVPMFIVRGAPGAGKSTFAKNLRGNSNAFIFETDNFFVDSVNHHDYHFDPSLLGIAHSWNQGEVIRACRDCPKVPIIVANTFRQKFELKPYFDIAQTFKRGIFVFTLRTEHDNVHNVPEEKVKQMRLGMQPFRWEDWGPYPFQYSRDIVTDDEAAKFAKMAHDKYFNLP